MSKQKLKIVSIFLWLVAIIFVTFCQSCSSSKITKGPFLLRVEQQRAALMWETNQTGQGQISYAKANNTKKGYKTLKTTPEQIEYKAEQTQGKTIEKQTFVHKVWLEDLQPGQTYTYFVSGADVKTKTYKFHTQDNDDNEVTFAVYGDTRTYADRHRKIAEKIMNENVDFVVHTGDLIANGNQYEQWKPQFFDPLKGLAESVPVYAVKGNHDTGSNGFFEKFLVPPGENANYSFDFGPVHYFCADQYIEPHQKVKLPKSFPTKAETYVLNLICADMSRKRRTWNFVSWHEPALNFGGHWSMWGYPDAVPIMTMTGMDFVLTGHSHQYERFRPIIMRTKKPSGFTTHITTGGGGAPLYNVQPTYYHMAAKKIHHFCLFHIKSDTLTFKAIDIDGNVIDHFEVSKTGGRPDKQYQQTAVPLESVRLHQDVHSAFAAPMDIKPKKNEQFNLVYKLAVPPFSGPVKLNSKLRCNQGSYKMPEEQELILPKAGGYFEIKFAVTPLVDVKVASGTLEPPLWIDCHYRVGEIEQSLTQRVRVETKAEH